MRDVLGLGQLSTKLLETLEKTCGYIFKPLQIKRIMSAQTKAIKDSLDILDGDVVINIDGENISTRVIRDNTNSDNTHLQNIVRNELIKQENVDLIISKTIEKLKTTNEQIDLELDQTWLMRFFEDSKFITDEEMQEIWATILFNETTNKARYSLRTLEFLRSMSTEEAKLFVKLCKCCFFSPPKELMLISPYDAGDDVYGLTVLEIIKLSDIGLINDSGKLLEFKPDEVDNLVKNGIAYVTNVSRESSLSIILLTNLGKELATLVQEEREYTIEEIKKIFKLPIGSKINLHKMISEKEYEDDPYGTIEY